MEEEEQRKSCFNSGPLSILSEALSSGVQPLDLTCDSPSSVEYPVLILTASPDSLAGPASPIENSDTNVLSPLHPKTECRVALRWLKHTGFPQYAHLYEAGGFPIEIDADKLVQEYEWLQTYPNAVVPLMERLQTLNACALRNIWAEDDDSDSVDLLDSVDERLSSRRETCETRSCPTEQEYVADEQMEDRNITAPPANHAIPKDQRRPAARLERGHRVTGRPRTSVVRTTEDAEGVVDDVDIITEGTSSPEVASARTPILVRKFDGSEGSDSDSCSMCEQGSDRLHEMASLGSPGCSGADEEGVARRGRWHSFSNHHHSAHTPDSDTSLFSDENADKDLVASFCVIRMLHVRHMALLKLTTQFECYVLPRLVKNRRQKAIQRLDHIRKKTHDYDKSATVFGVPLDVLTRRCGQAVPKVILHAVDYILKHGMEAQGLFRVGGSSKRIKELRRRASQNEPIDFTQVPISDLASVVKEFFREIPGRLLPSHISETLMLIQAFLPEELKLQSLQHTMLLMADENREMTIWLLEFLHEVATFHEKTKMDVHNLAVVFAPTIFVISAHSDLINGYSSPPCSNWKGVRAKKRDYDEGVSAISVLELMIQNSSSLQRVPMDTLTISLLSAEVPMDFTEISHISELGRDADGVGDYTSYVEFCLQGMMKEHHSGYRHGWVQVSTPHPCEISRKKVRDGHHLRLWRGVVDVPTTPQAILTRILYERHLWDKSLLSSHIVEVLESGTDVVHSVFAPSPGQPQRESVVMRSWASREDLMIITATSVRHPRVARHAGVLVTELATRFVIEPVSSTISRLSLIVRHDVCGHSVNFYKNYGPWSVAQVCSIRDTFFPAQAMPGPF